MEATANGVSHKKAPRKSNSTRDRYTDDERKKLLAEFVAAPNRAAWAKARGLALSMLHRWRRRLMPDAPSGGRGRPRKTPLSAPIMPKRRRKKAAAGPAAALFGGKPYPELLAPIRAQLSTALR